jgi:hypothetical protein
MAERKKKKERKMAAISNSNEHTISEQKSLTASCVCGSIKAQVCGEAIRVSMCHCFDCQKRTGSVFGVQARFLPSQVTFEGEAKSFTRTGDSGGKIHYRFCPNCGTTLSWTIEGMEGVAIGVGCFADSNAFPPPSMSVYETRAHPWASKAIPTDAVHWD